jgi:glycosyltransferase involved in cell wall biosynthesis
VCRALSRHFRLSLLSLCETEEEALSPVVGDGVFSSVDRVHLPRWRSWLNCLGAVPTGTPLQIAYYRSREFRKRVEELAPRHDGVLAHLIRTGEYLRSFNGPKFLEMTDAISLNYARVRKVGAKRRRLQSLIYSLEARRLLSYERSSASSFDATVLVSRVDRDYLFPEPGSAPEAILVCGNGVDAAELPFQFEREGRDVVFIGNLTSVQNLDAASYFAGDVLPRIRSSLPEVRFRVVGRIGARDSAHLSGYDGVDVTGEVESIPGAALGGGVGVCPLRLGAGVQNKVLEYMALGLPTVSTALGLEGFEARPGTELLVADEPDEFARAVVRLLTDRAEAEEIARAARAYVVKSHSWYGGLGPLIQVIDQRIRRAP